MRRRINLKRLIYLVHILIVISLGLVSRKVAACPNWIGDMFWAMMIYFGLRFLQANQKLTAVAFVSLLFCYLIEISQLYQAAWINSIRATVVGHLILGNGFLWTDIVAYTIGVLISLVYDRFVIYPFRLRV